MPVFAKGYDISFGDCDPAGIVFYPNYFRWMDATFHAFLNARAGGHAVVCAALNARGLGLMEARLSFRAPAGQGDPIEYRIEGIEWANRSFDVAYAAWSGDRMILEGLERRGVFVDRDDRMAAAEVAPLRELLDAR